MKVNPVGIQTYQQLNRRDNQPADQIGEQQNSKIVDKKITISPQEEITPSKLAVKAHSGDYSKYLSPEEKNALDILFARYKETGCFGLSYRQDSDQTGNTKALGRVIDVKV